MEAGSKEEGCDAGKNDSCKEKMLECRYARSASEWEQSFLSYDAVCLRLVLEGIATKMAAVA